MNKNSKKDRRSFIKKTVLGVGAVGLAPSVFANNLNVSETENPIKPSSNHLEVKIAGYEVNRVAAIVKGKVQINGCSHIFKKSAIGDINTNILNGPQTYDITEIGLHPFMVAYANDNFRDYTLLPIFPVRIFRHKSVFIRNDRGINKPEDLKGKTIGTAGYSSSSLTWIRGIFQDEYGIHPKDVNWVISNKDSSTEASGKISKNEQIAPKGINLKMGTIGLDESELLVSGEVDALFHAAEPAAYMEGNPLIERLFPDSKRTEQAYYKKTGIFPIMHAVAIRKTLIDENPWIVKAVFEAYSEAKKMDYKHMKKLAWVYDSLPWYGQELEATNKLMGKNFWPYGIEPNRKSLETLFRYSFEQGLCSKNLTIDELFYPASIDFSE